MAAGLAAAVPKAPDLPLDADEVTEAELSSYVAALTRNGFFGPNSWYMNPDANRVYQDAAVNDGRLDMPVLFLHGDYDALHHARRLAPRLADPDARGLPRSDRVRGIATGHWMAQENPVAVNAALARWIATKLPSWYGPVEQAPI